MTQRNQYETDPYAWSQEQVALLKAGRLSEIDVNHLIEELEEMGSSDKREIASRLKILIAHLLKWQFMRLQLDTDYLGRRSWEDTILEQRSSLKDHLEDHPSLDTDEVLFESIKKAYPRAAQLASKQTKLPLSAFPKECPYTKEQLFDEDFYPEGKRERN